MEAENKIHDAFGDHRVNPKREFFRIDPERVLPIFKLIQIKDVTPKDDIVEDQDEQKTLNKERSRRENFTFKLLDIPVGSILHYIRDENVTVKVVDDRRSVEFNGEVTFLAQASKSVLNTTAPVAVRNYWVFEDETLFERRLRLEEVEAGE